MLRSRLFWKVLTYFGVLLIILTAMTTLTLLLMSQIQMNFTVARTEVRALGTVEQIRSLLNDIPTAAYQYGMMGAPEGKGNYSDGWKYLQAQFAVAQGEFADSAAQSSLQSAKEYCIQWKQEVGDRLILLGDERALKGRTDHLEISIRDLTDRDTRSRLLSSARNILGALYEQRLPGQIRYLDVATGLSGKLTQFVILVNVLLAIFSLVLGFMLTRSITTPIRVLKAGTRSIMEGSFEPIDLRQTDELGDLAADFNKMSALLGSNYNRLNAYSELVTTLNSSASMEDVQRLALEILCRHTHAVTWRAVSCRARRALSRPRWWLCPEGRWISPKKACVW